MSSLLQEADSLINGARQDSYGSPAVFFAEVAKVWSVQIGVELTAKQVIQLMVSFKLMRTKASPDHRDSWLDLAGYAGLTEFLK